TESVFVEAQAAGKTYPRQRFTAVPYALRVPVDGQTVGYDTSGHLTLLSSPAAGQAVLSSLGDATTGATAGSLLAYDGTKWTATTLPPPPTLGGDLTGSLGAASVAKIQGKTVVTTGASTGDFLKWDGSQWAPGSVTGAAGGTVTSVATTTPLTLTGNA